jgi:nucleoside-diphosphate-sugar epimerase
VNSIVITGGAGFIGSGLARALLAQGARRVVAFDNLLSGKEANLAGISGPIELVRGDIRDYDAIHAAVKEADTVFHLAAIPSVPRSITDPVPSHEVNIDGTFTTYRACAAAGIRRVVYAASSAAYGDTEVLPKVETMTPQPKSPYALQKLVGEQYGHLFTTSFGLEVVSLRFFNVFGPRQDPTSPYSGVLSIFMTCLLERRAPTIFGDGLHSRDFTYVEDVAGLCIKAAQAPSAVAGRTYNAGNGDRFTLTQTWNQLCAIEGVNIQPDYGPPRVGDVRDSQADTTAAVRDLGHAPRFTFEQGLRLTLDWYRNNR